MVQKIGAQYVAKRFADMVTAPPPAPVEEATPQTAPPVASADPGLEGQVITDENGERVGVARKVANVAVYVIAEGRGRLDEQLVACINDDDRRVFFHHSPDGRLTGVIYAPDPQRTQALAESVTRPDDI